MSDFAAAQTLHESMTADSLSYLPLSKEELREHLDVSRIENPRAGRIVADFAKAGLLVHPAPTKDQTHVRVFRLDTDLGRFAQELLTAEGAQEEDRTFEQSVRRLEGATPAEVYRRIRETFEAEGWVKFRKMGK